MTRAPRGILIAGTASNVGKTTVATGLAGALRARGLNVQPFKTGPDYIDPTYLARAAGRPCRNLDTWMLTEATVSELYARAAADADIALVEGVMGLYDGSADGTGSAAHLARLLALPVVLVVDASSMAQSAAALVLGFQHLDPQVRLVGVILNRVASTRHATLCGEAITAATGLPILGALPRSEDITIPTRHLGLVPDVESPAAAEWFDRLSALIATHIDLDALLALANPVAAAPSTGPFPPAPLEATARIAIARDAAFHFYYQDSLDLLEAWGGQLVPFSPLEDSELPADCGAVYIGGGFPELFAASLAANAPMSAALREAAWRGTPIYGECGGLMYLGRSLTSFDGERHDMVGLLPADSVMRGSRLTLGYREVESCGTPLLPAGERMRGHEFHWSALEAPPDTNSAAYRVLGDNPRPDGFRAGSVTATYVHAHMASRADLAPNFVATAGRERMNVSAGVEVAAQPSTRVWRPRGAGGTFALATTVLFVVAALALTLGAASIPPLTTLAILLERVPLLGFAADASPAAHTIVWDVRVPRVLTAGVAGAALAYSGATYQGVFRNPLADPYLLGVASGAAVGAAIAIVSPLESSVYGFGWVPLLAFAGAAVAVMLAYAAARVGSAVSDATLILAGIAIASIAGAITSFLLLTEGERAIAILSFLFGSFNSATWPRLLAGLPYLVIGSALVAIHARTLNVLQLDEEQAAQLGVDVTRTKFMLLAGASLVAATAVAMAGVIGFVGLIVPHVVRMLWGNDYRRLLPLAALTGASFLIAADMLARTALRPQEVPVGIVTALIGGPFFLYLMRSRRLWGAQ